MIPPPVRLYRAVLVQSRGKFGGKATDRAATDREDGGGRGTSKILRYVATRTCLAFRFKLTQYPVVRMPESKPRNYGASQRSLSNDARREARC